MTNTTQQRTPHEWTDEQIRMGIAGCFGGGIVLHEEAVFQFVKGVLADKEAQLDAANARIAALEAAAHQQCDDLAAQVIELRERAELAEQLLAAEWAEESEAEANALAHEFRTTRTYQ